MFSKITLIALTPLRHDDQDFAKGDEFQASEARAAELIAAKAASAKPLAKRDDVPAAMAPKA